VCLWRELDGDFYVADVNAATCDLAGRPREGLLGATPEEVTPDYVRAKRHLARALKGEVGVTSEFPFLNAGDGRVRRMRAAYSQAGPSMVIAFLEDITDQRVAEERLRASEERYRQLVAAANEGVWLVDHTGRTTFANGRVGRILGHPMVDIIGGDLLAFVDERDRTVVRAALECPRDTPAAFEARFRHRDGRELLCLLSVSPVPTEVGVPTTLCILADMTALQRERDLREASERRYRRMVETASEGVWTGDREGRTTFVNEAAARMVGLDPDAIVGRPFSDFVGDRDAAVAVKRSLARDGQPVRTEVRLTRDDGTHVDAIASLSVLRDDNGAVEGSIAMVTDVTQLRREHAELLESRERFAHVFEDAPVGIVFISAGRLNRGSFLAANDAFHEMVGYSADALRDHDLLSVTHPDDVEAERALARRVFERDEAEYQLEKRYVRPAGESVWARFRVAVVRDERGTPLYGLGVAVDISAEKAAASDAADSAARAQAVLAGTPDGVFEIGADRTVKAVNDAAVRMFGVDPAEIVGRDAAGALAPSKLRTHLAAALDDCFTAARAGRIAIERIETTMARADSSEFPAELRLAAIEGQDPGRFMLSVRNLGVQERAEAARRQAEERFERIFSDGATAIAVIDMSGRLAHVNSAFCALAGRTTLDLQGRDASDVLEDAGDAHEAPWPAGTERPGPVRATRRIERADGRTVTVHTTASVARDAAGTPLHWICQCIPQGLGGPFAAGIGAGGEPLSYRERQVLGLLARGHDGPAIADRRGLSPETVRSYANSARQKIGAKTRTEAVALALARGEITL
jgi:PAS domain S-box-containing protein